MKLLAFAVIVGGCVFVGWAIFYAVREAIRNEKKRS